MKHSCATEQRRRAEELVCWTCGERIRFLWYRLCLTVQEMTYTAGQMIEFHMGLTSPDSAPRVAHCQQRGSCRLAAATGVCTADRDRQEIAVGAGAAVQFDGVAGAGK